jgi:hypothetical protein
MFIFSSVSLFYSLMTKHWPFDPGNLSTTQDLPVVLVIPIGIAWLCFGLGLLVGRWLLVGLMVALSFWASLILGYAVVLSIGIGLVAKWISEYRRNTNGCGVRDPSADIDCRSHSFEVENRSVPLVSGPPQSSVCDCAWTVYSADGEKIGRIDRDGIAYSAFLGGRVVGRVDEGTRCVETTTGKRGIVLADGDVLEGHVPDLRIVTGHASADGWFFGTDGRQLGHVSGTPGPTLLLLAVASILLFLVHQYEYADGSGYEYS